jgi:protein required for attachment to host cells
MSTLFKLPHDAWVLVADARKAILFWNEGDEKFPNLRVKQVLDAPPNPPTREQGADRPGRVVFGTRRSAVGQTDWHRAAEEQFAARLVEAIFTGEQPSALVVAAPPQFLAALRKRLPAKAKSALLGEVDKDLTHLTASEIEKHLTGG